MSSENEQPRDLTFADHTNGCALIRGVGSTGRCDCGARERVNAEHQQKPCACGLADCKGHAVRISDDVVQVEDETEAVAVPLTKREAIAEVREVVNLSAEAVDSLQAQLDDAVALVAEVRDAPDGQYVVRHGKRLLRGGPDNAQRIEIDHVRPLTGTLAGMRRRHASLALALAALIAAGGCGYPPVELPAGCLGTVHSEIEYPPGYVEQRVQLAAQVMVEAGFYDSEREWCENFRGVEISVYDREGFDCKGPGHTDCEKSGKYHMLTGVKVVGDMGALVHELLHVRDSRRAVLNSARHPGWDRKGYNAAALRYWQAIWALDRESLTAVAQP